MIRFLNVYYPTRTVLLLFCEVVLVSGGLLVSTYMLLGQDTYIALFYDNGLAKIAGITVMTILLSYYFDLYEPQIVSAPSEVYFRIVLILGVDCFFLSALMYFFPALWIGHLVYVLGLAVLVPALIFWRKIYDWICSHQYFRERVYVLGSGQKATSLVEEINSRPHLGMEVTRWNENASDSTDRIQRWQKELAHFAQERKEVQRIIIDLEDPSDELPVEELLTLRLQGVIVETSSKVRERVYGKVPLDGIRFNNFLDDEGFRAKSSQKLARRITSFVAAATGLLLFLPFFPIVILLVKCSSKGPVFFKQKRVGLGGKEFFVFKFRTMRTDAEADGARWASKNDPRVTVVGRFMRKTRIDEVPQLWNVLRGDMSFVGPRPERPEFMSWLSAELPFYNLRNSVHPGLTGWAQVRYGYGASLSETREKLEYDLYYVKHMCLGLDLLIMFETIKTIVRRRGAQ
jgi:sugar transferase (PEP-CTERM system associated)